MVIRVRRGSRWTPKPGRRRSIERDMTSRRRSGECGGVGCPRSWRNALRTVTSAIVLLLLAGCAGAGQPGARQLSLQLGAEGQFAHVQAPAISLATTAAEGSRRPAT